MVARSREEGSVDELTFHRVSIDFRRSTCICSIFKRDLVYVKRDLVYVSKETYYMVAHVSVVYSVVTYASAPPYGTCTATVLGLF